MPQLSLAPLRVLRIRDFSGGLNLRDAPPELAENESPDLWNVTLDERGGVAKRLGYSQYNATAFSGGLVQNTFYWNTGGFQVTQAGAVIYKADVNTARKTFTTSARVGFCDFAAKLWAIHPVDGLFYTTDGITWTAVVGSPLGSSLISWQNRLLSNDSVNVTRINASAIGDGTDWSTAVGHGWNNELREKDTQPIICLAAASGVDIAGRPGVLALKRDSTYRIYDSSTGAYQTLDPNVGAASALSVVTLFGRTIILSREGIFWTDGIAPLKKASERVDPLFQPAALAEAQLDLCAAGALGDRCYFSIPRYGQTANDLALEYHPVEGWIVTGSNAASCYSVFASNTQALYAGSPTVSGRVYQMLSTGADDGVAIASRFQTRWFEPSAGFKASMPSCRVLGRGNYELYRRINYETGQGRARTVTIARGGFTWNDPASIWNNPATIWGPATYQGYSAPLNSLGTCRSVSFVVSETSSLTATAPNLLVTGSAPTVGAWGLSGLDLQYVQLGIS
jgi:hypothetical protein